MAGDNYTDVLLEDMRGQIAAVLEYVSVIPDVVARLGRVEAKVDNLESDMKVVKALLVNHEGRITTFEKTQTIAG